MSYKNKTVACNADQVIDMNDPLKGYFDPYFGIEQLMDPEKYVDTGVQLSKMHIDSGNESKDGDEVLTRWEHISSNTSKDYYHVYQDWQWSN